MMGQRRDAKRWWWWWRWVVVAVRRFSTRDQSVGSMVERSALWSLSPTMRWGWLGWWAKEDHVVLAHFV